MKKEKNLRTLQKFTRVSLTGGIEKTRLREQKRGRRVHDRIGKKKQKKKKATPPRTLIRGSLDRGRTKKSESQE